MEAVEAVPGAGRLERLADDPEPHQRVAGVGGPQERVAPLAGGAVTTGPGAGAVRAGALARRTGHAAVGRGRWAPATVPPWSRHSSSARAIGTSTGWSADSKPRTRSAPAPGERVADSIASPASSRRQFTGNRPDWASARTAAAPVGEPGNSTPADVFHRGRSCRRIHASVITPSAPSEPRNRRSGDGPAPDPGSRRDSVVPDGVTTRSDSQRSSMWVYTVAKWPPARVASQPPRVENSNDCG